MRAGSRVGRRSEDQVTSGRIHLARLGDMFQDLLLRPGVPLDVQEGHGDGIFREFGVRVRATLGEVGHGLALERLFGV